MTAASDAVEVVTGKADVMMPSKMIQLTSDRVLAEGVLQLTNSLQSSTKAADVLKLS
jgi:hypothetical protein